MGNYDYYLAASLQNGKYDFRNISIENVFAKSNKKMFRPTIDARLTPLEILERNIKAIEDSDNFLFIADNPGEGVFIELGYALSVKKNIYILGDYRNNYGKMFSGVVESLPENHLFHTLLELEKSLT